jgi:hypothetical protein
MLHSRTKICGDCGRCEVLWYFRERRDSERLCHCRSSWRSMLCDYIAEDCAVRRRCSLLRLLWPRRDQTPGKGAMLHSGTLICCGRLVVLWYFRERRNSECPCQCRGSVVAVLFSKLSRESAWHCSTFSCSGFRRLRFCQCCGITYENAALRLVLPRQSNIHGHPMLV